MLDFRVIAGSEQVPLVQLDWLFLKKQQILSPWGVFVTLPKLNQICLYSSKIQLEMSEKVMGSCQYSCRISHVQQTSGSEPQASMTS